MKNFVFFSPSESENYTRPRKGETKLGEVLEFIDSFDQLPTHKSPYVIIGIPEDIGIRANYGKPGAASAWEAFLAAFLNIQINAYQTDTPPLLMGRIDTLDFMAEAEKVKSAQPQQEYGKIVQKIDQIVAEVVDKIMESGKIPIVIGGGHNNSYGIIKGCSKALHKPINVLNIDAHTDLRKTEYRHSGNGFSYAQEENFLKKYAVFGLHKNYTPEYIFDQYANDENIQFKFYEALKVGDLTHLLDELKETTDFLDSSFGIELDVDSIAHFPSSAMTPSGFNLEEIRNFLFFLKRFPVHYLHLAEAVDTGDGLSGKALSYLVSDFIRKN